MIFFSQINILHKYQSNQIKNVNFNIHEIDIKFILERKPYLSFISSVKSDII